MAQCKMHNKRNTNELQAKEILFLSYLGRREKGEC